MEEPKKHPKIIVVSDEEWSKLSKKEKSRIRTNNHYYANYEENKKKRRKLYSETKEEMREYRNAANRKSQAKHRSKKIAADKARNNKDREKYLAKCRDYYNRTKEIQKQKNKERYLKKPKPILSEQELEIRRAKARERIKKMKSDPVRLKARQDYEKEYRKKNSEKYKARSKEYREENKKELSRKKLEDKWANPSVRIAYNLRNRLRLVLNGSQKSKNTIKLVGLNSFRDLQIYIESLFTKGMCWNNYGIHGWHIDHIKPCSSFDLTIPKQQEECFHYTNLRPLWATTEIAMKYGESEDYVGNLNKNDNYGV